MYNCHQAAAEKNCQGHQRHHGKDCRCSGGSHGFHRRFISSEEMKEHLELYKDELQKELTGVDEQLKELSS